MKFRSLATSVSVVAACVFGSVIPGISGEIAQEQPAPFQVTAVQGNAPNFVGLSNWFKSSSGPL